MRLPPGWSMAGNVHYQRDHHDDRFGTVMVMPLEGDTLEQHVRSLIDEGFGFGLETAVTSQQSLEIDGHPAIELVTEASYHVYELHILRDGQVTVVSLRTLPDAFAGQLEAFRNAGRSIRFE